MFKKSLITILLFVISIFITNCSNNEKSSLDKTQIDKYHNKIEPVSVELNKIKNVNSWKQ